MCVCVCSCRKESKRMTLCDIVWEWHIITSRIVDIDSLLLSHQGRKTRQKKSMREKQTESYSSFKCQGLRNLWQLNLFLWKLQIWLKHTVQFRDCLDLWIVIKGIICKVGRSLKVMTDNRLPQKWIYDSFLAEIYSWAAVYLVSKAN